jgi:hypothetical protein
MRLFAARALALSYVIREPCPAAEPTRGLRTRTPGTPSPRVLAPDLSEATTASGSMPDTGRNTRSGARDNGGGTPLLVSGAQNIYRRGRRRRRSGAGGHDEEGHYKDQQNVGSPPSAETLRP